jgi:hypothetical protein
LIPCSCAHDNERKKVEHANKHALKAGTSTSQNHLDTTLMYVENGRESRWRKCTFVVNNLYNELCSTTHCLINEDKKNVLKRFLDKDEVKCLLPEHARNARDVEYKLGLLESLKAAYAQLVTQKSKENRSYKNALLTIVVSNQVGPF